jgi:hypothetical protein
MAYLLGDDVFYDQGGTVRALEGVTYDDGRRRNLSGPGLSAVKYDDGGRFRTLIGGDGLGALGDCNVDPDTGELTGDCGTSSVIPIDYVTQQPIAPPSFYVPSPVVDTTSAPITGNLMSPAPVPASSLSSDLLTIFQGVTNTVKTAIGASTGQITPGTVVSTTPTTAASAWFGQSSMVSGLPNWGVLAGGGVLLLLLARMSTGGGGGGSRRRRNPAELILMGANPRQERTELARSLKKQSKRTRRLALRSLQTKSSPHKFSYGMERIFSK